MKREKSAVVTAMEITSEVHRERRKSFAIVEDPRSAFFSSTVLVSSFASAVYFLLKTSQIGQPTNTQRVKLHHYSCSGLSFL